VSYPQVFALAVSNYIAVPTVWPQLQQLLHCVTTNLAAALFCKRLWLDLSNAAHAGYLASAATATATAATATATATAALPVAATTTAEAEWNVYRQYQLHCTNQQAQPELQLRPAAAASAQPAALACKQQAAEHACKQQQLQLSCSLLLGLTAGYIALFKHAAVSGGLHVLLLMAWSL
jgi:hypothetical protein